jgi:predicted nuclease with TOPRIM domain
METRDLAPASTAARPFTAAGAGASSGANVAGNTGGNTGGSAGGNTNTSLGNSGNNSSHSAAIGALSNRSKGNASATMEVPSPRSRGDSGDASITNVANSAAVAAILSDTNSSGILLKAGNLLFHEGSNTKIGFLSRNSSPNFNWKLRYVKISLSSDGRVVIAVHKIKDEGVRTVPHELRVVHPHTQFSIVKGNGFAFTVSEGGESSSYMFNAHSQAVRDEWIRVLDKCVEIAKKVNSIKEPTKKNQYVALIMGKFGAVGAPTIDLSSTLNTLPPTSSPSSSYSAAATDAAVGAAADKNASYFRTMSFRMNRSSSNASAQNDAPATGSAKQSRPLLTRALSMYSSPVKSKDGDSNKQSGARPGLPPRPLSEEQADAGAPSPFSTTSSIGGGNQKLKLDTNNLDYITDKQVTIISPLASSNNADNKANKGFGRQQPSSEESGSGNVSPRQGSVSNRDSTDQDDNDPSPRSSASNVNINTYTDINTSSDDRRHNYSFSNVLSSSGASVNSFGFGTGRIGSQRRGLGLGKGLSMSGGVIGELDSNHFPAHSASRKHHEPDKCNSSGQRNVVGVVRDDEDFHVNADEDEEDDEGNDASAAEARHDHDFHDINDENDDSNALYTPIRTSDDNIQFNSMRKAVASASVSSPKTVSFVVDNTVLPAPAADATAHTKHSLVSDSSRRQGAFEEYKQLQPHFSLASEHFKPSSRPQTHSHGSNYRYAADDDDAFITTTKSITQFAAEAQTHTYKPQARTHVGAKQSPEDKRISLPQQQASAVQSSAFEITMWKREIDALSLMNDELNTMLEDMAGKVDTLQFENTSLVNQVDDLSVLLTNNSETLKYTQAKLQETALEYHRSQESALREELKIRELVQFVKTHSIMDVMADVDNDNDDDAAHHTHSQSAHRSVRIGDRSVFLTSAVQELLDKYDPSNASKSLLQASTRRAPAATMRTRVDVVHEFHDDRDRYENNHDNDNNAHYNIDHINQTMSSELWDLQLANSGYANQLQHLAVSLTHAQPQHTHNRTDDQHPPRRRSGADNNNSNNDNNNNNNDSIADILQTDLGHHQHQHQQQQQQQQQQQSFTSDDIESIFAELTNNIAAKDKLLASFAHEIESLKQTQQTLIAGKDHEIAHLSALNDTLHTQLSQLSQLIEHHHRNQQLASGTITAIHSESSEQTNTHTRLELIDQTTAAVAKAEYLLTVNTQLSAELDAYKDECVRVKALNATLEYSLTNTQQELSELSDTHHTQCTTVIPTLKTTITQLNHELSNVNYEHNNLKIQHELLVCDVAQLQTDKSELQAELQSVRKQAFDTELKLKLEVEEVTQLCVDTEDKLNAVVC